jgi:hypothetical protein
VRYTSFNGMAFVSLGGNNVSNADNGVIKNEDLARYERRPVCDIITQELHTKWVR